MAVSLLHPGPVTLLSVTYSITEAAYDLQATVTHEHEPGIWEKLAIVAGRDRVCKRSLHGSYPVQERRRKWDGFASGEALFGLPVTAHPELQRTVEELSMLGRLYGLYRSVIDTIRGYGDYLWSNVVSQVGNAVAGMVARRQIMGPDPAALRLNPESGLLPSSWFWSMSKYCLPGGALADICMRTGPCED